MSLISLGQFGEEYTCKYLQSKGYTILDRNFRNKIGEIDIIAQEGTVVCFIEVKTRRTMQYGAPFEAVHSSKQRKMVRMALSYLKYKFRTVDVLSRFDVISIYQAATEEPTLHHLRNAFDLTYLSH
ncbi:MAG: YraN family protein [Candidatus Omnitrophica bacterium]|nr:YraN family protein [Candidatus Omnitrophota bacterium]